MGRSVPLKSLVGLLVKCSKPVCGATARVRQGSNPPTALGSTAPLPRPFVCWPPGSIAYRYPDPGPRLVAVHKSRVTSV
jgi:hypothetical protein